MWNNKEKEQIQCKSTIVEMGSLQVVAMIEKQYGVPNTNLSLALGAKYWKRLEKDSKFTFYFLATWETY